MFCANCGKPTEEGAKFCAHCGCMQNSSNQESAVPETQASQMPVEETNSAANSAQSDFAVNNFATPSFDEFDNKPKKKKSKKVIITAVAVLAVVVLTLVAVLNLDYLKGAWLKNFGSDKDYYVYVEKKALDEGTSALVNGYGKIVDTFSDDGISSKGNISFEVSDAALDIAESYIGSGDAVEDIVKIINNVKFNVESNQKDGASQGKIGVELGKRELIGIDIITNMLNGDAYVGAPDYADGYLMAQTPMDRDTEEIMEIIYSPEFWEALPSDSILNDLIDKYIEAALKGIDDVSVEKGKIEVENISENCTVIEYDISEKLVYDVALAVLETVKDDSDLEDIVKEFNEYADKELPLPEEDMYDVIEELIDEAIDEIKYMRKNASGEAVGTLITYVNSNHEIIGRELISKSGSYKSEIFSIKTAEAGGKFATELKTNGMTVLSGEGTKRGDVIKQGEYVVIYDGDEYLNIELTDFDASNLSDFEVKGTIKLTPGRDMLREIMGDDSVAAIVNTIDPTLSIDLDCTENSANVVFAVLTGDEPLIKMIAESKNSSGSAVDTPDDVVDAQDYEEIQNWLESIDLGKIEDTVVKSLEDIDVSSDIIDAVLDVFETAENAFNY